MQPAAASDDPTGTAPIASVYALGSIDDDAATVVAGRIAALAGTCRRILAGAIAGLDRVHRAGTVILGGGGLFQDTADNDAPSPEASPLRRLLRFAQESGRKFLDAADHLQVACLSMLVHRATASL